MKEYFWGDVLYISLDDAVMRILHLLIESDKPDEVQEIRIYKKVFCDEKGGAEDEQE